MGHVGVTKLRSVTILLVAEVAAMSLWFVSAAVLPEMLREVALSPFRQALLSSSVQAGFVAGALISAVLGIADRFDPRRTVAIAAVSAALCNALLLAAPPGGAVSILARFATGAALAGVYPVGMKIVSGWGVKDRGLLVGALVGSLTLGSASPHLISLLGGADWRTTVVLASLAAGCGGLLALTVGLGPHHAGAARFDPRSILIAWTDRRVRYAYLGYFGHMWELYAMWAWVGVIAAASYAATLPADEAGRLAKLTAFLAIGLGGFASAFGGFAADRIGKAETAIVAMALSGASAIAVALTFGGMVWITFVLVVLWGITIIPDSAQFSALVADAAPPGTAGSLLTLQTSIGFALTFFTVQIAPVAADAFGWPSVIAALALGPAFGIVAMMRHRRVDGQTRERVR